MNSIVATAVMRNPSHGVTGFLSFNGQEFLQFIEGPEDQIRGLMDNIERDPRHSSVMILSSQLAEQRFFPGWQMQQLAPSISRMLNGFDIPRDLPDLASTIAGMDDKFSAAYARYLTG